MIPLYVFLALILTIAINLVMALMVLGMSTAYRRSVRPFVYSATAVILWTVGAGLLQLGEVHDSVYNFGIMLFLISPLWVMYFLLLFILRFPQELAVHKIVYIATLILTVVSSLAILVNAEALMWRTPETAQLSVFVPGYIAYAMLFMYYTTTITLIFFKQRRRLVGLQRAQVSFVYSGAILSSALAFTTNLLLPILGNTRYIWLGPVFTLLYASGYAIAIKKYRLFDIRQFAARAITYVATLLALLIIYSAAVYLTRYIMTTYFSVPINIELFYATMMLITLLVYIPVKRSFDSATHDIFFRQEYNEQDVIDQLGNILLRANTREAIITQVGSLLKKHLKVASVEFQDTDDPKAAKVFNEIAGRSSIVDVENDISKTSPHVDSLKSQGVALVIPLQTRARRIGWMILGQKKNGAPYTARDIKTIDIATDEIAIAIDNATQYEQIESFNKTLQVNIKEATKELEVKNKQLREIDASKDEFISMASHQLRTPLTSIKGYISMMLDGDLGEIRPEQRKALEEAYDSSQRMVYLIGDFLNLSRIQTGRFELEKTLISLPRLLGEEIDQLRQSAKARKVTLLYNSPSDFPEVALDETKIRQVMMNFIDNAVYYAKPDGGEVLIVLEKQRDEVIFTVKDNGIGVPARARGHLFTKFYRADNAKKARPDGTGIGLYMAKRVVVAHGGSIIFESKEGEGSEFGFRLPTHE
jgi:signal transduction histidine kinase